MLSSVDKIQKFFKLEIERGFDNRAVVGGLDKILPAWESEARANQLQDEIIQAILDGLRAYPGLEPAQRAEKLSQLMEHLEQAQASAPNAVQAPGEPLPGPIAMPASPTPHTPLADNPGETPQRPQTRQQRQQTRMEQRRETRPVINQDEGSVASGRSGAKAIPDEDTGLNAPLRVLQGVGNRLSQTLASLGLNTLEDLLFYFPRRYDDYSQLKPINRLEYGEVTTVLGTIQSVFTRPIRGGKLQLTEAVVTDGTGALRVTWFNQPWLSGRYTPGTQVVLAGKVEQYLGRPTMGNPEIEPIEQEHLHTNRIVPVYPLTAGLTQKNLRRILYQTITYWAPRMPDYIPEHVRNSVKVMPLSRALLNIHFPESQDLLDMARWRLAFDEIFLLQLGVLRQKRTWETAQAHVFETAPEWLEEQVSRLPFSLTGAQQRVIAEIALDLSSGHPMDRLIQGDVGSGKTVVAAMAVLMVTRHGAQAAFMAPTSILAEQHYRSLTHLLAQPDENDQAPLRAEEIRLLIGDTPEAEKEEIRLGLENGAIKLVIGTHALIESPVQFKRLQLAVIDEQHRFGVAQRSTLRAKGENPHLLVMTATPIPRSLALTVYGDLDLSVMDEMPPGRQPVETFVVPPVERERAYQLIRSQVGGGRQAFIIYPLVEQNSEDEEQPKESQPTLLSAVEESQRLQKVIFPKMRIGLMHGRLKPEEKDGVMKAFRDREYDVLVSTTVVEVGVDIPNASVMLIEGANRFGLAQLHQLRGRVGRGSEQSFCLLIPDNEDALENQRLAVMTNTNDGFVLAEQDLQLRGPGEFLGTRQAGYSELKLANLTDVRLIEKARQQAQALFKEDCDLSAPEHQPLAKKLVEFWEGGRGDIS
jgi:ATP-dependent DNA helicase RecG